MDARIYLIKEKYKYQLHKDNPRILYVGYSSVKDIKSNIYDKYFKWVTGRVKKSLPIFSYIWAHTCEWYDFEIEITEVIDDKFVIEAFLQLLIITLKKRHKNYKCINNPDTTFAARVTKCLLKNIKKYQK